MTQMELFSSHHRSAWHCDNRFESEFRQRIVAAAARARRRRAPRQADSETSCAAADRVERTGTRVTVWTLIVAALLDAGPDGLTIAELAGQVTQRRGRWTSEATICGRVAGRDSELDALVCRSGRQRVNASGARADVWIHRVYAASGVRREGV